MIVIVKSGQLVVNYPLEFSETVTKFILSIHFVCLPENENVFELEDISMARKINQTLKIQNLEKKMQSECQHSINFFKIADDEDPPHPPHAQRYQGKSEIICSHAETSESDDECAKRQERCNEGEVWLYCHACHQWYQ